MKFIGMIMALGLFTGCASLHGTDAQQADILIFDGKVTAITPAPVPQSRQNWVVTMKISRIEQGQFSDTYFSFRVHSPSKSGLTSNGMYRVEARVTQDGYAVDEFQWTK